MIAHPPIRRMPVCYNFSPVKKLPAILRKTDLLIILFILGMVLAMLSPLRGIVHFDEEDFRFTIMPTVLFGRAVLDEGQYPFWTSDYAFGMPTAFFSDLNLHPLSLLITRDVRRGILLVYALHLLLGGYGMWRLSRRFGVKGWIGLVGVVSFLLSSPVLNYTYADFWLPHLLGYMSLPWILLLTTNLLKSQTRPDSFLYAVGLGVTIGFTTLISYPPIFFFYGCIFTALFVLGNPHDGWRQKRWLLLSLGLILLITGAKIYTTFSELALFDPSQGFSHFPQKFGGEELWSIFLRPILFNSGDTYRGLFLPWGDYYQQTLLVRGVRHISFGPIFTILAILGLIFRRRTRSLPVSLGFPVAVFALLYVVRPDVIYNFVSAPIGFCNSLIPAGILIAGETLTWLVKRSRMAAIGVTALCLIQVSLAGMGAYPFWKNMQSYRQNVQNQPVISNVVAETPLIQKLKTHIGKDGGRLLLSPLIQERISIKGLMKAGIAYNSLPYHGLRAINGQYKGVSYRAFCPDMVRLIGLINPQSCGAENQDFYDLSGVRYVLKATDEDFLNDLQLLEVVYNDNEGLELGLYENPRAWDEAEFIDGAVLTGQDWRAPDSASLSRQDLKPILQLRRAGDGQIRVAHRVNHIVLEMEPGDRDRVLMLSEFYRQDWQAIAYGAFGSQKIAAQPALRAFVGMQIPAGTTRVELTYRPLLRMVIQFVSLAGLILAAAGWGWLAARRWIRSRD